MEKSTSTTEVEKVKLYSHEEIVKKIFILKKQNGISLLEMAKGSNIAYSYFGQMISQEHVFIFKGKTQAKICKYFERPEIKAIFSGKESLFSHEEIVNRVEFLNKEKGIRYKQIAQDAGNIAQFYFMQLISPKFPNQLFKGKTQVKICKYFESPEIKLMLKGFEKASVN